MSYYLTPEQRKNMPLDDLEKYIIRILCKLKNEQKGRHGKYLPINKGNLYNEFVRKLDYAPEEDDPFAVKFSQAINKLEERELIVQLQSDSITKINLTSTGEQLCLAEDDNIIIIDDVTKLTQSLKEKVKNLDPIVEQYYEESIRSWKHDLNIASTICLGAASERAIRCLADAIICRKPEYEKDIGHNVFSIKAITDYISNKAISIFESITDDRSFIVPLKDKLEGIARLYRINRNETGHPEKIQEINSDDQRHNLYQFRQYITTVFEAINKLKQAQ